MEFSLWGEEVTKARFRQYMASNPAIRRGWVNLDGKDGIDVADEYVESFAEIAANFGLEVSPAEGQEAWE